MKKKIPMWVKALVAFVGLGSLLLFYASSFPSPQLFDSNSWLSGNAKNRGSMVRDINDRQLLKGKTKSEIERLLGKPDFVLNDWVWAYKVETRFRCNIWDCGMELGFDPQTNICTGGVSISD